MQRDHGGGPYPTCPPLTGQEFAVQHVIPNFYFHVTTAYALLRANGVDVGKRDYLGAMPFKAPAT